MSPDRCPWYTNIAENDKLFKQLGYFSPPILLLFFVRSGMNFKLDALFNASGDLDGVPLIVDNTFATPINCRPFEWGADIVTHSTTKYMDGTASQVGGAVVDSGNFDWMAHAEKFPGLCTPDESYHGLTYVKAFGKMGYTTKLVAQLMRTPHDPFGKYLFANSW